jgi:DNA-binding GntR family transcriptional regulator
MTVNTKGTRSPEAKKALLYLEVAAELRSRIANGRYPQNSKLPTLHDLVEEFGVSAISVRRALRELSYEGLIVGEQGRGIFVKPKGVIHRVFAVDSAQSIGDSIRHAGFVPRIQELKTDHVRADVDLARRLQVTAGTRVNRHQKLVFADDAPVSLHFLYFTEEIAPKLRQEIGKSFAFSMLQHAGFSLRGAHCEFGSVGLPGEYAELFAEVPGFPMGVIHFTPVLKEGKPPLTGMTIFRSDRFVFEVDVSV